MELFSYYNPARIALRNKTMALIAEDRKAFDDNRTFNDSQYYMIWTSGPWDFSYVVRATAAALDTTPVLH